ncbi:Apoptosis-inducing factor 2 [Candida viswanathii]|uniref:Apoptosis-inducing factor 2 n=1 Tax=Candida viswanathii TaxID=5486 RepID=A0A367YAY3_9ASCO|nr:Apoptosis-inducing factor 2 [Candida viswanathii]
MPDTTSHLTKLYHELSIPTFFNKNLHPTPKSFTTNILIVGGSYSGLSTLRTLQQHLTKHLNKLEPAKRKKVSITLIEPRDGLLNILGIPKCLTDVLFADTQYVPFNKLANCRFTNIFSDSVEQFAADDSWFDKSLDSLFEINYIQGKVCYLDQFKAQYNLNGNEFDKGIIEFDYVALCSGRDRSWPTTPRATTVEEFLAEMGKVRADIEKADVVSVIGAGAVGIEIAGDVKTEFPNKTVNLIHPHENFPPEPLSLEFKRKIQESIENSGIDVYFNTRIKEEKDNGDLVTTTDKLIPSGLNFWCCSKSNNTSFLSQEIQQNFISKSTKNIAVNSYLQLHNSTQTYDNFFVLGDLVDFNIIKSAGWAMYMGRQTANNLTSLIFDEKLVEPLPDLSTIPFGGGWS